MATILRVKRRHEGEAEEALVLKRKRAKSGEEQVAAGKLRWTVAKFAGTLKDSKEEAHRWAEGWNDPKSMFAQCCSSTSVKRKVRGELARERSAANRYRVTSCLRSVENRGGEKEEEEGEEEKKKRVTLIDVEDSISLGGGNSGEETACVYDVYYAETEEEVRKDDRVYVEEVRHECEWVWERYYKERSSGKEEYDDDDDDDESEDSNSERNRRNDYPSSEYSEESIDEEDMRRAASERFSDSGDLSSEEEEEAVDEQDRKQHHGYRYARYKQRMKRLFISRDESEEEEEEEEEEMAEEEEMEEEKSGAAKGEA